MCVQSIYNKKVVKLDTSNKKDKSDTFKDRLFYAIIPNQKTKMTTYYFSKANSEEARSVARGLPLFIRDHYKLKPSYFCSSNEIMQCLEGDWDFKRRSFLAVDEKMRNTSSTFSLIQLRW